MVAIEFGYWNLRGYMQPIRLMCEDIEVKWTEKKYELRFKDGAADRSDWVKDKENLGLRFPNLPYMIDRDSNVRLTESFAIIRYLAQKFKPSLLGKTNMDSTTLDMLYGVIADLRAKGGKILHGPASEYEAALESAKEAVRTVVPKLLESCNPYLIGDYITYVDYVLYEVLDTYKEFMPEVFKEQGLKSCREYLEMFENLPKIAAYMKSPDFITTSALEAIKKLRSQCPNPVHKQ